MKNYLTDEDDNELFILNYEKTYDQIIINFANGNKKPTPNTNENEKKILDKMDEQIKKAKEYINVHKAKIKIALLNILLSLCAIPLDIYVFLNSSGISQMIGFICGSWFVLSDIVHIFDIVHHYSIIKDIEKNLMYLNNKEKLNKEIEENEEVLLNVKGKTKEMLLSTSLDEPVFTANSIDKLKYKELRLILKNMRYQEKLKTLNLEDSKNEEYDPQILSLMEKYDGKNGQNYDKKS